jgi:hypothetical protein
MRASTSLFDFSASLWLRRLGVVVEEEAEEAEDEAEAGQDPENKANGFSGAVEDEEHDFSDCILHCSFRAEPAKGLVAPRKSEEEEGGEEEEVEEEEEEEEEEEVEEAAAADKALNDKNDRPGDWNRLGVVLFGS